MQWEHLHELLKQTKKKKKGNIHYKKKSKFE